MPQAKAAFDASGNLEWTGDETATVIFGKSASNENNPVIRSVAPGVFEGEITIPEGFTIDDIRGIVTPAENGATFRYNSSNGAMIQTAAYTEQLQEKNGVFNPKYCAFIGRFTSADLVKDGDVYTLPSVQLIHSLDLLRFNVYGKHADQRTDEIVQSVTVQATEKFTTTLWVKCSKTSTAWGSSGATYGTVKLEEQVVLPESKENGVKMYLAAVFGTKGKKITNVEVVTDKAVYTKEVDYTTSVRDWDKLTIDQIGLDLSTFNRRDTERENYYRRKVVSIAKGAGLPSIQVTYTHGDDMISFVAVNDEFYANTSNQENSPLNTTTVYQACSMSKVPVAYVAMKMVEEGRLDLMKPVYQYYGVYSDTDDITDEEEDANNEMLNRFIDPTAKAKAKLITTKMILLHTTGLDNGTYSNIRSEDDGNSETWEWTRQPDYTNYVYSGPAIHILDKLLGKILGDQLGSDYDDLAKYSVKYIFDKVGIVHANYFWTDEFSKIAAKGHRANGDYGGVNPTGWKESNAAYTLRTSTEEYTKFLKWINTGADFTDKANYDAMFGRYGVNTDTETSWQGLIWRAENHPQIGLMYHHRGNNGNYKGWMCTIPAEDKTLMFMTNGETGYNFYKAVAKLFLGYEPACLASTGTTLPSTSAEESETLGNAGSYGVEIE